MDTKNCVYTWKIIFEEQIKSFNLNLYTIINTDLRNLKEIIPFNVKLTVY